MRVLLLALLVLALSAVGLASPLEKFERILTVLQNDSVTEVSRSQLRESALGELRRELQRRNLPEGGDLSEICCRYPSLVEDETILRALTHGAGLALDDPYLCYLEPLVFGSIGDRFQGDSRPAPDFTVVKDEYLKVLEVGTQGPIGLRAGDQILSIDGQSAADWGIEEARAQLHGPESSVVTLEVRHPSPEHSQTVQATRIKSRGTVTCSLLDESIGYLRIGSFAATTPGEVSGALARLESQGAAGLVIDLRNNGGGLVASAVQVCSSFLTAGTEVVTVERRSRSEVKRALPRRISRLPLVILVNGESASAAEIMAAALHDAQAATLVGSRTFGKGTVQRYVPLGDGSGLKFTSAHYRTPKGTRIHGSGILPDVPEKEDAALKRCLRLLHSRV